MTADPQTIAGSHANNLDTGSPVARVSDCFARITESNDVIRAMIFVAADEALREAHRLEAELAAGRSRGPLHGVPIAVKDVIDVSGWPTTGGSRLFEGRIASEDAPVVSALRKQGAIIIGKTNLHELTAGGHANPWFGTVVNPLAEDRGTGGTSSGSAAAVAAGFCEAALGTDTGGSNRSTAAATGLYGLKPTNGTIDAAGILPTAPSFDTVGPIAESLELTRLVHFAMTGRTAPERERVAPSGLTIGLCPDFHAASLDSTVKEAHEAWLRNARNKGAKVTTLRFAPAAKVADAGFTILAYEFAARYGDIIAANPENVGEAVHAFLETGLAIDETAYHAALAFRAETQGAFLKLLRSVDVLAAPVAPGLAPRLVDETTMVGSDHVTYGPAGGTFRRWANFFGVPALAMPLPIAGDLPAAIQLSMPPLSENRLFAVAEALGPKETD
ncbi:amidase [Martelella sp. FLE1502]